MDNACRKKKHEIRKYSISKPINDYFGFKLDDVQCKCKTCYEIRENLQEVYHFIVHYLHRIENNLLGTFRGENYSWKIIT